MEIINHEAYVSLKVAKLLREAGFDWKVNTCRYNSSPDKVSSNGTLTSNFNGYAFQHIAISAPTLDVAQRWLREVKECAVIIETHNVQVACVSAYVYCIYPTDAAHPCKHINGFAEDQCFDTYEVAQEAGIKKALELILEKGGQHDS